ncbi:unnamed protein product [Cylindrotheca closterium]|uniref:PSP proline-rich domain-containing protein n=1 Tax=Cylindrotheca closterium TaxID=2856 RepID=A0AAD2FBQ6_9STRA|nr:unnamed protein product [Cylindrotheca closterium]
MGLSAAEKNRRKRGRKKREKEERRKQQAASDVSSSIAEEEEVQVEIEYVAEPIVPLQSEKTNRSSNVPDGLPPGMESEGDSSESDNMESVLRRFHQRAAVASTAIVSDVDETNGSQENSRNSGDSSDSDDGRKPTSKRKLRELIRPSVAELKRRVKRPDLVEAHDVTSADPDFLLQLKSIQGTVSVPRHWGRKRKYLQGKRGFEKPPFQLPDFIVKTGITEIRDTVAGDEANQSVKQKNRSRVNPKMGAMDVDYKTLYEAFFKFQTKPINLTKFGDLYYEGKELETSTNVKPGGPLSKKLREALSMESVTSPPPWLVNMQRYGPPPSYPNLSIPGLNAPLPDEQCQYGYHTGGWGKPPVDAYGRPLYGGNPFDAPGSGTKEDSNRTGIVTSDGKTIGMPTWGSLPTGDLEDENSDLDESSAESESDNEGATDMEESDGENENEDAAEGEGIETVMPPPPPSVATMASDLRKLTSGDETPAQLYRVLEQKAPAIQQAGVFQSDVHYVVPGTNHVSAALEGATSVLSKAMPPKDSAKRKRNGDDDEDGGLGKSFKF